MVAVLSGLYELVTLKTSGVTHASLSDSLSKKSCVCFKINMPALPREHKLTAKGGYLFSCAKGTGVVLYCQRRTHLHQKQRGCLQRDDSYIHINACADLSGVVTPADRSWQPRFLNDYALVTVHHVILSPLSLVARPAK